MSGFIPDYSASETRMVDTRLKVYILKHAGFIPDFSASEARRAHRVLLCILNLGPELQCLLKVKED